MNHQHIVKILDRTSFANLSKEDLTGINSHIVNCQNCRQAFQSARLSSLLLRTTVVETPVPSPFFQSKLLNVWREKQIAQKSAAGFQHWWQASAAPVFSMLTIVFGLIAFTVFAPNSTANSTQADASNFNPYTTDSVILNQKNRPDLTTEQALQLLDDAGGDSIER